MATNIKGELSEIKKGRYGIDIRIPIHDALAILAEGEYELIRKAVDDAGNDPVISPVLSDYDITEELEIIDTSSSGAEVKQAIRDALYKLSLLCQDSKIVVTRLTNVDISSTTAPSGNHYISGLSNPSGGETDWEALANFLYASGLFAAVDAFEEEGLEGIKIYIGDSSNPELFCTLSVAVGGVEDPVYTLTVENLIQYPDSDHQAVSDFQLIMAPLSAYRSDNAVLINCAYNGILIAKNSDGGISVSTGVGTEIIEQPGGDFVKAGSKIRTFTKDSTRDAYAGFGCSVGFVNQCSTASLTSLVSEGDEAVSLCSYGRTCGDLSSDCIASFGSARLYMSRFYFAIEI